MNAQMSLFVLVALNLVATSVSSPMSTGTFVGLNVAGNAGGLAVSSSMAFNHQAHAKMTFLFPHEKTNWQCGHTETIRANTFALGSQFGLSSSILTLVDNDGRKIADIMNQKSTEFIQADRTAGIGRARFGRALYKWTPPVNMPTGYYRIEYEGRDMLNMDRTRLKFISDPFYINCVGGNNGTTNGTFVPAVVPSDEKSAAPVTGTYKRTPYSQ
ncbi:hypothetical protein BKA69DRAFT_202809 [Paraphysoderma sedebokerense]|nr:hypothetical protein BKA69DRAFT_202809 [Paraphysoderma sedebokerense]